MAHVRPLLAAALGAAAALVPPAAVAQAPQGTEDTRYCMRIEAITGSRIERIACWTRAEWAAQGVDVDTDWATEGIRTID